jgi:hypothetical protein
MKFSPLEAAEKNRVYHQPCQTGIPTMSTNEILALNCIWFLMPEANGRNGAVANG